MVPMFSYAAAQESEYVLIGLAKGAASHRGLDPSLVCAVIEQESNWDTWAIRFEPGFEARYEAGKVHNVTEETARSMSWGLMQVMGETARDCGYQSELASLCYPENGLAVGCTKLAQCLDAKGGDVHAALQMWNGGGNPNYADEAMARMAKYQPAPPTAV